MAAGADQTLSTAAPIATTWPGRRLRRAESGAALVGADLLVALAAGAVGTALPGWAGIAERPVSLPVPAIAIVPLLALVGVYPEWGLGPVERLRRRGIAIGLHAIACLMLALGRGDATPAFQIALVTTGLLALAVGHYAEDASRRFLTRRRRCGVPAALIGDERQIGELASALRTHPEFGLTPVALIRTSADEDANAPSRTTTPVIADLRDAVGLSCGAEVAIVIDRGRPPSHLMRLPFRHVVVVSSGRADILSANLCPLGAAVGLSLNRDAYKPANMALKRSVDIAMVLPMLLVAGPLILLFATVIKTMSPGPAIFRQRRIGRGGAAFDILKLRTMHIDAQGRLDEHLANDAAARDEWQRFYKLRRDPRVLPGIGWLLRRSSLDELPQLINILLGQMSLVGPRPFPDYHVAAFDEDFRALRASVLPGLTGFWQISSRSDGDLPTQQRQDTEYILNWSLWFDLYVILRTPVVVLAGSGAR